MHNDEGWALTISKVLGLFMIMVMLIFGSRACSRAERNMVSIRNGYCYDRDTQIIYIESYAGRYGTDTTYSPYYDSNGDLCKYNVYTGEWIPVDEAYKNR